MTEPNNNIISPSSTIGTGARLGQFIVIEDDVVIGDQCEIGHHVVIRSGTRIGNGVQIGDQSVLGKQPMKAANSAVTSSVRHSGPTIGDSVRIGTTSIIYAGCDLANDVFVADLVTIREKVSIGEKTIVGRGVAIENQCTIGSFCKIETNAYITAYSTLGDRVFVAPGVLTSNDNFIGRTEERFKHFKGVTAKDGARLGVGAVVLPGVKLEKESVLAAGSVQTRDSKEAQIHMGVPAKPVGPVPEEQLLSSENNTASDNKASRDENQSESH